MPSYDYKTVVKCFIKIDGMVKFFFYEKQKVIKALKPHYHEAGEPRLNHFVFINSSLML